MCLLCADLIKDKITPIEARRNLQEISKYKGLDSEQKEHILEVIRMIEEKEEENERQND